MAMFSRRHYKAIADCLKERREQIDQRTDYRDIRDYEWEVMVSMFSTMFERDNPGFKPDRFLKAAGFSE